MDEMKSLGFASSPTVPANSVCGAKSQNSLAHSHYITSQSLSSTRVKSAICQPPSPSSTIIVMVEIYLNVYGSQISFLSIPHSDVQMLSVRPFKWLRFVMFSICGARGDLSAIPDGPPVDYESAGVSSGRRR